MPRPQRAEEFPEILPRVPANQCTRCRKEFQREDRVVMVHMCVGVGYDSQVGGRCIAVSPAYEVAHLDCADPQLRGRILNLGT